MEFRVESNEEAIFLEGTCPTFDPSIARLFEIEEKVKENFSLLVKRE